MGIQIGVHHVLNTREQQQVTKPIYSDTYMYSKSMQTKRYATVYSIQEAMHMCAVVMQGAVRHLLTSDLAANCTLLMLSGTLVQTPFPSDTSITHNPRRAVACVKNWQSQAIQPCPAVSNYPATSWSTPPRVAQHSTPPHAVKGRSHGSSLHAARSCQPPGDAPEPI